MALLDKVIARLETESIAEGCQRQFEQLKVFLTAGKGAVPYADAAKALGVEVASARQAVHRLRKHYRQLLREEIAQTLADPAHVEEELRALFQAFGGTG